MLNTRFSIIKAGSMIALWFASQVRFNIVILLPILTFIIIRVVGYILPINSNSWVKIHF